ncbi:hypothetical protein ACVGXD_06205, partial [Enterobacter intestinihominis]
STGAAEMSTSTIEARARAPARLALEAELTADYELTSTPQSHRASEAFKELSDIKIYQHTRPNFLFCLRCYA